MAKDLTQLQHKASYFVIAVVMWEFFSYYGMQALLILYLTQKLHFTDANAYQVYGSFTSLIYVTPIVGGWLADRFCGYRYAVMVGCIMIMIGHLILGGMTVRGLYVGLTCLILGIGLFKSNAICLIGECYPNDSAGKSAAFIWYYISGNLGSISAMLVCPYIAQVINWSAGFVLAAIGMAFGIMTMLIANRFFTWQDSSKRSPFWQRLGWLPKVAITVLILLIALGIMHLVLIRLWAGYLLSIISIIALGMLASIYRQANPKQRQGLWLIFFLTLIAGGFWIFDQQGSSSVSLFILRYVDRTIGHFVIPAGMFQAINPTIILIIGVIMAWVWHRLGQKNIKPSAVTKLTVALLLLTLGFMIIAHAGLIAHYVGLAPMWWPIVGLALVGSAEIFVDPVILATITDAAPGQAIGRLTAMYYLVTGAVANYVAAWVAELTIDPTQKQGNAITYHAAYLQIVYIALALFVLLLVWSLIYRKRARA